MTFIAFSLEVNDDSETLVFFAPSARADQKDSEFSNGFGATMWALQRKAEFRNLGHGSAGASAPRLRSIEIVDSTPTSSGGSISKSAFIDHWN